VTEESGPDLRCSVPLLRMEITGPRFSANDRPHFRQKQTLTQDWRTLGLVKAREAMGTRALMLELAHMYVFYRPGTAGKYDPANCAPSAKAAIDGMVQAGMFVDDSHQHLIGPDYRAGKVQRRPLGLWVLVFDVWVPPGRLGETVHEWIKGQEGWPHVPAGDRTTAPA
jgi:hypothetical protein